jgi:hypothetical protein
MEWTHLYSTLTELTCLAEVLKFREDWPAMNTSNICKTKDPEFPGKDSM